MTSKIVVNNIEADSGINTITFINEVTAPTFNGNIVGTAATFSGNVDIAGALTYEDVTNVDSVGIVTARSGIHVTGGSVGLGTDNPDQTLHLYDSTAFASFTNNADTGESGILFRRHDNNQNRGKVTYSFTDDALLFRASNNGSGENLRITSGGALLVAKTTTSLTTQGSRVDNGLITVSGNSNSTNLAVNGGGNLSLANIDSTDNNFSNIGGYNSNGLVVSQIDFINKSHSSRTGEIAFLTHNGSAMSERLRIDSTGDVRFAGTNLTNNTNKNVNLTAPSYNTSEEDVNLVQVENESGMNQISFGGGTTALNAATSLRFLTASAVNTTTGTERLSITSAGKVLINSTANSDAQLLVKSADKLHPALKLDGLSANGFSLLGDEYHTDESNFTMGLAYSSASLVTGWGVKVSPTASNEYLSSQDTYSTKHSAVRHDGDGWKFLSNSSSQTVTTDSVVSLAERLRIASDGKIHVGGNGTGTDQLNIIAAGSGINIARMNSGNASVNEWLGAIGFKGYATGNSSSGADARIHAAASHNHSGSSAPADLIFSVKPTTTGPGSAPTERMRILNDGMIETNGVMNYYASFRIYNNQSYNWDIPVPNEGGYGNSFRVEAGYNHYYTGSYGAHRSAWASTRGTSLNVMFEQDQGHSQSGYWSFSKPNNTTFRVTKSAGSYGGQGYGFIHVRFNSF